MRRRSGGQAGNGRHRAGAAIQAGHAAQQLARAGVKRGVEHGLHGATFDHLAGIHDGDAVAHLGHEVEVVADEQDGDAPLAADTVQHGHHLRLDRHVERRGGFVCDQQLRVRTHGQRRHDPLAHAAAEFVGIGAGAFGRVGDADQIQQFDHSRLRSPAAYGLVSADAVVDLAAEGDGGSITHQPPRVTLASPCIFGRDFRRAKSRGGGAPMMSAWPPSR